MPAAGVPEALAGAVAPAEVGGEAVVLRVRVPPGAGAGAVDVLAFEGEARAVGLGLAWLGAGEVHRVELPAAACPGPPLAPRPCSAADSCLGAPHSPLTSGNPPLGG